MVVAALNQASPRVVDCNDKATEKLVHALERLTSRMDNLQTKVRDLRARSHGTECGGYAFPRASQQSPEERREQRCACGRFGCRSTSRDPWRGRSPQRRSQSGYSGRDWSPRERGTQDNHTSFSPLHLDGEDPREPRFTGECQPRWGVRFLTPTGRSPSLSSHGQGQGNFQ